MDEQQPQPQQPGWLSLSSFDAQSFFAQQQQERKEQAAQQAAALQAAADYLLPSSSEDESGDSGSEGGPGAHQAGAGGPAEAGAAGAAGSAPGEGRRGWRREPERGGARRRRSASSGSRERGGTRKRRRKEKRDKKHKEGRKKKGRTEEEKVVRLERLGGEEQRAGQVRAWASAEQAAKGEAPFYYDTRGDPANTAFGGLYRMDVAMYRRHDPAGFAASLGVRRRGFVPGRDLLPTEADGHSRGRAPRYYGAAMLRLERSARLRRWRRWQRAGAAGGGGGAATADRLPAWSQAHSSGGRSRSTLRDDEQGQGLGQGQGGQPEEGETQEEFLLRRTRDFNVATRERPYDLQLWLDFAKFQDDVLRLGPHQRGGERAAAEKKVAILERALAHHPGSDQLLLALLEAAQPLCSEAELEGRWRKVLARHGGSPRLWRAYLRYRLSYFSGFNLSQAAEVYLEALQALHRERQRRARQGAPADVLQEVEVEAALLAVEWCGLQLASGHSERGVAGMQALLEYTLFAPEGWGEGAKREMFADYWSSGDPFLGELGGGRGWAGWLAGVASDVPAAAAKRAQQEEEAEAPPAAKDEDEGAGWGGWEELAPGIEAQHAEQGRERAADQGEEGAPLSDEERDREGGKEGEEEEEEEAVLGEEEAHETEEELLERLGMDLDKALEEAAVLTPPLLAAWLGTEAQRDAARWQPRRAAGTARRGILQERDADAEGGEEGEEAEARVQLREVAPLLVSLESEAAVRQLVLGCLLLLGAPLLGALGSGEPAAASAAAAGDELWQAACWLGLGPVPAPAGGAATAEGDGLAGAWLWGTATGDSFVRQVPWYQAHPSRHQFLLRLLTALVQGPCRAWGPALPRALLVVSSQSLDQSAAPAGADTGGPNVLAGPESEASPDAGPEAGPALPPAVLWDWAAGRALAKQLLSRQRESLQLWGAYAWLEGRSGNLKAARKVYQTCFATVAAPAWPQAKATASLALAAAQLELSQLADGAAAAAVSGFGECCGSTAAATATALAAGALAAPPAAAGAALRLLAWLGAAGAVAAAAGGGESALAPEHLVLARRGYQGLLLSLLDQGRLAFDQGSCDLVACAASFEVLEAAAGSDSKSLAAGVRAALAIYDQVLAALQRSAPAAQQAQRAAPADAAVERLCVWRGALLVEASARGLACAAPGAVRQVLLDSLRWFPASGPLLQLLLEHQLSGHRIAQLRRDCRQLCAERPSPQAWLAALAAEARSHGPPSALAGVLERAVACDATRNCPLLWRCYARLEASRRRPDAARRVFLRGVGGCPWSKSLWLDGLALLNGHAPPKELAEYLEILKDKELLVRTDVYEVALAQLEDTLG